MEKIVTLIPSATEIVAFLGKKNLEMSKNFMVKVDKIIMNYAKENSIDLLLKRESLIVSNSALDITKDILSEVNKTIKKID